MLEGIRRALLRAGGCGGHHIALPRAWRQQHGDGGGGLGGINVAACHILAYNVATHDGGAIKLRRWAANVAAAHNANTARSPRRAAAYKCAISPAKLCTAPEATS